MYPQEDEKFNRTLDFLQGDEWQGCPLIRIVDDDDLPPDTAADSVVMQFRTTEHGNTVAKTLTSEDGDIVITSAANWTFVVLPQLLDLLEGTYLWFFQVTDIAGNPITYLKGNILVGPPGILPT